MAKKFRAWVGTPGGGGQALRLDGTIVKLDEKPPESEFVDKPAGAPSGDFIQTPNKDFRTDAEGNIEAIEGSQFARIGRPGARTARTEFIGEVQDRRNQNERIMAAKLGARMGAKKKLDTQGMRMGYTPVQERKRSALMDVRGKLESEFSEGKWTAEQMKQLEEQVTLKENAILPQMMRQQPTSQEQFNSAVVQDPVTGIRFTTDKSGNYKPLSTGMTSADRLKLVKEAREAIEAEAIEFDKDGKPKKFKVATAEEVNAWIKEVTQQDAQINAAMGGIDIQQNVRPTLRPQQQAPVQPAQPAATGDVDLSTLDARANVIVQKFKNNDNVNWEWVEDNFGKESRKELEAIVASGNEQAIAKALQKMKVI